MKTFIFILSLGLFTACGEAFLDTKPNQRQRVPASLEDYLGLMDYHEMMNKYSSHVLAFIGSDEYYMTDQEYHGFPVGLANNYQKNAYTWNKVVYEGNEPLSIDWTRGYTRILWTNVVIDGLDRVLSHESNSQQWKLAKGAALFHRALNYYSLAQLYAPVYTEGATEKLGLPLRLEPDVMEVEPRASLADTYRQIITDLTTAEGLLPDLPSVLYRPSKWSVFALLARCYLQMGKYDEAGLYASKCLDIKKHLIDFNTLDLTLSFPLPLNGEGNEEVILHTLLGDDIALPRSFYNPDTTLVASYEKGDLRKEVYFKDERFSGSYDGTRFYFTGLSINEVYLIKAETAARAGDLEVALDYLNTLRKNRFTAESFIAIESTDQKEVLERVLLERRKEVVMRGIAWRDFLRLNREPEFERKLVRKIDDQWFELPPNDSRCIWPIPEDAVRIGGYPQNER